ncbi:right-handed parallel beta-helix repeat-containing protein, partial [Candidatus Pelagibacter bacterium]|nr:right-handed parallel beta-helix repeat-containing protein [Candidatus Pelagibacter bacterium]
INIFLDLFNKNKNYNIIDHEIQNLNERRKILINELSKTPNAYWSVNNNNFSLILDTQLPVNKVELTFKNEIPDWVFIDENYNNNYDLNEVKFYKKKNKIILDVNLYSNRVNKGNFYNLSWNNITTSATKFNLISSNGKTPTDIKISSFFVKDFMSIKKIKKTFGAQTNSLNKVLFNKKYNHKSNLKTLSGEIIVKNELIFEDPIQIKPGTIFLLDENANIIFKNKVEAIGTKNKKIIFKANSNKPWGTIALLGKKTAGSKINFAEFSDGSGSFTDQLHFTSMFSIHNTENISVKNIIFKNNHFFDDMLHIIYSSDVIIENLTFHDAFGDAIDIDISKNIKILDSNFYNSKNDGIDLMESKVDIKNVNIFNSKDKAISIGESSNANLSNSKLEKNGIAVAVKDNSKTLINNVIFLNNVNQISAYKKNLQYGSGGEAIVSNSIFENKINNFSSENSNILINNSKIVGGIKKKGKKIILNERK